MPSASDTPTPALAPAGRNQRQEPVLNQPARSDASHLPASIAGAFAAAAYSMQHSLQHEAEYDIFARLAQSLPAGDGRRAAVIAKLAQLDA